jgi:hypothetical protein
VKVYTKFEVHISMLFKKDEVKINVYNKNLVTRSNKAKENKLLKL